MNYHKVRDQIADFIRAVGPVSFHSIKHELAEQCQDRVEDYQLANMLTEMIRAYRIELYDDGESFVITV